MAIRTLLLAGVIAGLGLAGTMASAKADPLDTTFGVNIWNFKCPNCTIDKASQKALPGNPDKTAGNQVVTNGTYTGALNFDLGSGGTNSIGAFFTSGGGTGSPDIFTNTKLLSTGTYNGNRDQTTTLMEFTFSIGSSTNAIFHDDGVSVFATGSSTDLLPVGDADPTAKVESDVTLTAGTYNLWYVEANGLPAVLKVDSIPNAVPEPGSLALLGTALAGLGLMGFVWRRRNPVA